MSTRVSSGGLLLGDGAFRGLAPAYAETARSLAGRATELYELATGVSSATGEPPVTALNPQGRVGWDLSGPPWGSALRHNVAWFSGRSADANLIQPDYDSTPDAWYNKNKPAVVKLHFWNRPHDSLSPWAVAPHARLYWVLRSVRVTGADTPTATLRTWNRRFGQTRETGQTETFTTPVSETQVTGITLWVPAGPGWNTVYLEVSLPTTSASTHQLTSGALQVLSKRGY